MRNVKISLISDVLRQGHAGILNVSRIFNVSNVSVNESKPVKGGKDQNIAS